MKTKMSLIILLCFIAVTGTSISLPRNTEIIQVKGKVTDRHTREALSGVFVRPEGTMEGVLTDSTGFYTLSAAKGYDLIFSVAGYKGKKITVRSQTLNVELVPETNLVLKEVAVADRPVAQYHEARSTLEFTAPALARQTISYDLQQNEEYGSFVENRFLSPREQPLSTFSVDVDAASYSNMRRMLNQGKLPPKDAIRTEELVNYFSYDYPKPEGKEPVKITTEIGTCPWNEENRLVKIAIKAREIPSENLPASNFVFLIDVSGSMYGPSRLGLVQSSLKLLINNLRAQDKVAIVVYAGSAGEVLPPTSGSDKQKIREALENLTAGGSTAGGAGIQLAYKTAKKNFIKGGNNRIILCTDGDFNVGVSTEKGLEELIEQERKSGVFLSVLGYGMGNYKDSKMQVLAQKGNGNHAYIDNMQEANKVLVNEFGGTMYTVAKDVKLQLEFNPAKVQAYRLIGYESRLLAKEDFNDDQKDAGEMGAGHTVTAFYEIIPSGVDASPYLVDKLKYQPEKKQEEVASSPEMLTVKLRYKEPDRETIRKLEQAVTDKGGNNVSEDFRFASAVAMFGQLLSGSDYKGSVTFDDVRRIASLAYGEDPQGYRREFVRLVDTAKGLKQE